MRVLLVEDDAALRSALAATLRRQGFEVFQAGDGAAAQRILAQTYFPIVVTDWIMPVMDGLELVRALRSDGSGPYTYIIMLTGNPQSTYQVGMEAGADDFLIKPCSSEELTSRLNVARRIMALQQELEETNRTLRHSNRELEEFRARLQLELGLAARVQASLLPSAVAPFPEVTVAWALEPSTELAGDVLNVLRLDDRHLGVYVLDVSGHGVSAALFSTQLSRMLSPDMVQSQLLKRHSESRSEYELVPPAEVMDVLNQRFRFSASSPHYFTLVYGLLDVRSGRFEYASAGHPGPMYISRNEVVQDLTAPSTPIGLFAGGTWEQRSVDVRRGDALVLFSDGVTETPGPDGEMLDAMGLQKVLMMHDCSSPQECCDGILKSLALWRGGGPPDDDCSVLVVRRN